MDKAVDTQVRLRLIEAAAALPAVRQHSDATTAALNATEIAKVWYTYVMAAEPKGAGTRKSRRSRKDSKAG